MRSIKNWLAGMLGRRTRFQPGAATMARPRLVVERLEDRTAPAVLTVNSTADTANNADPYLSLREAIAIANSPTLPVGLSPQILGQISGTLHGTGNDTILFDISSPIMLGGSQLKLSLPSTSATITIDGGAAGVTVDGNHDSLVLQVDIGVQAQLTHLTLRNGNDVNYGGGIFNEGTMVITNCTIASNTVGGIDNEGGTITLQGCLITNNSALVAGGIFNNTGSITLTDTAITYNRATGRTGGGLFNQGGHVTMTRCDVLHNYAALNAGGIANYSQFYTDGTTVFGVDEAVLEMSDCTVSNNTAGADGGGIVNSDPNPRPDTHELVPATMTISDSTLDGNYAQVSGGAIKTFGGSLMINGCTLTNNSAGQSGGAINADPAVVTIISSTFSGNSAPVGADLYNEDSAVTIIASSITGIYIEGGTVTDPIAHLLAQVAALNLSSGVTNSLTSTLQSAQASLASANTTAAVNQLTAFINQLNALVNSHRLGDLTADSLINEVDNLIALIG
jgi:predicted outer membrane repeat protein